MAHTVQLCAVLERERREGFETRRERGREGESGPYCMETRRERGREGERERGKEGERERGREREIGREWPTLYSCVPFEGKREREREGGGSLTT